MAATTALADRLSRWPKRALPPVFADKLGVIHKTAYTYDFYLLSEDSS